MSYQKKCKYFSMEYVGNPGRVPACNRDIVLEVFDCSNCKDNPDNKIPTNADRIRAKSDEELAKFFERILDCESCFIFKNECGRDGYSCNQRITEWLKQEAKE